MPVPTLYLDTSIISCYFEEDVLWQRDPTRELWRLMNLGIFHFTTSTVTAQEIAVAPGYVRTLFNATFPTEAILPVPEEAKQLAAAYIRQGILTNNSINDALHVAACTVAGVEYLVSWNFKHLVNVERKRGFNAINLLHGYRNVSIVSPSELIYENRN